LAKLHIVHNSGIGWPNLRITEDDSDFARIKLETGTEPGTFWDIAGKSDSIAANGSLNFYYGSPGNSGDRMSIKGNGNVGIGTTNPAEKLHVQGTFRVSDLAGVGDRNVIVDSNGKFKIGTLGSGDSDWVETANAVYNNTHDIGVGTTSPGSKVHVIGPESNGTTGALKLTFPGTAPFYIDAHSMVLDGNEIDVTGNLNSTLDLQGNSAGGVRMVQGGGNVGIGTNAPSNKKVLISGQTIPSSGDPTLASATLSLLNTSGGFSEMLLDGNEISTVDETLYLNKLTNHDVVIASGGGDVGIGTSNVPAGYRLSVAGKVIAEELRVQLQGAWPDYVFDASYPLLSLDELDANIRQNHHLPGIPSADIVKREGIAVSEMQVMMMEKIEELTLYILQLHERVGELEQQNAELKASQNR
ncbi:MAG: hypothetical protein R3301_18475, partial [Saprospiraceae bacterium]|nr:hypothetical protein [Saprospiraceae bacterium]